MSISRHICNKEPLIQTSHIELPLGAVKPEGWLKNQLEIQSKGLTGNLEEIWESVGSYNAWLGGTGDAWERAPYYLDGLVPLAYLLEDEKLIKKAQKWIEWTLNSQKEDGFFGPEKNDDWWARMVMLKVLMQYYEAAKDERVITFMEKYFNHQMKALKERPLTMWGSARGAENIYAVYWLYNITGDKQLLELSDMIFAQMFDWTGFLNNLPYTKPTSFYYNWDMIEEMSFDKYYELMGEFSTHCVNVAMGIKAPGIFYQQSKDDIHKSSVFKGIDSLMKHHGLANGIWSGDEHLSGTNPSQGIEFCAVNEYMFSLETLLKVFDDVELADRLEKLAYNALPGTMTKDMCAHQYDQQPNQVLVTNQPRNFYNNDSTANTFGLEPNFGCCTANMHQGWPKFVKSLWMATKEKGLAAVAYGPCTVTAVVAEENEVIIKEETNYPFDGRVKFTIRTEEKVSFPLKLRVPGWAEEAAAVVNGEKVYKSKGGSYIIIEREWNNCDVIELDIPLKLRFTYWHNNSVAVERGSLLFSLKIGEQWRKYGGVEPYADWEIYPTTPWNYALHIDVNNPELKISVIEKDIYNQPFDRDNSPIILKAKGSKLPQWKLVDNSADEPPVSPVNSEEPEQDIELIPYAAAKLRVTQFPFVKASKN
jgi:DUF1680 family protein